LNSSREGLSAEEIAKVNQLVDIFSKLQKGEKLSSGKLKACVDFVREKLTQDPSNRIIIFIWFQEMAEILKKEFHELGLDSYVITGDTESYVRHDIVNHFNGHVSFNDVQRAFGRRAEAIWNQLQQDMTIISEGVGKLTICRIEDLHVNLANEADNQKLRALVKKSLVPIAVFNIKAAGEGLNAQAANHVLFFDRWWNPAVEGQAVGRSYRIGQTRTVCHTNMFCPEVQIDTMIEKTLRNKRIFQDCLMGQGDVDTCFREMRDTIRDNLQEQGLRLVDENYRPQLAAPPAAAALAPQVRRVRQRRAARLVQSAPAVPLPAALQLPPAAQARAITLLE
jgi:hypothetical protein